MSTNKTSPALTRNGTERMRPKKMCFIFENPFFGGPATEAETGTELFFAAVEPKALGPGRLPVQTFYPWSNLSVQLFWM